MAQVSTNTPTRSFPLTTCGSPTLKHYDMSTQNKKSTGRFLREKINDENIENSSSPIAKRRREGLSVVTTTPTMTTKTLDHNRNMVVPSGRNNKVASHRKVESTSDIDKLEKQEDNNKGSSVQKLKGWLADFERQQKAHYEKSRSIGYNTNNNNNNNRLPPTGIYACRSSSPTTTIRRGSVITSSISSRSSSPTPASINVTIPPNSPTAHSSSSSSSQPRTPTRNSPMARSASTGNFERRRHSNSTTTTTSSSSSSSRTSSSSLSLSKTKCPLPPTSPTSRNVPPPPGSAQAKMRFKPRIKKSEVQATDEGYASVRKLSQWLADDPFEERKQVPIRRGAKVSAKSRIFEREQPEVVDDGEEEEEEDCVVSVVRMGGGDVRGGDVSSRKTWLKSVFKKEEEEDDDDEQLNVMERKKWLANAFKKEGRCE